MADKNVDGHVHLSQNNLCMKRAMKMETSPNLPKHGAFVNLLPSL
ncbi:hypothetical protein DESC_810107 [Desulfosarcina cetonica]|nr:hypothetical protein DESC_810107 [Desulfosarcina cetonica]